MNLRRDYSPTALPDSASKPEFVRRGFNRIASRYDLLNDIMTAGLHRRWKSEVVRRLDRKPGMRILDLCAGTGDLAYRAAAPDAEDVHVTALDFAVGMMQAGRSRPAPADRSRRVSWICADASVLPFGPETFDGAMVGFGLRNVASLETTLGEVFRVLKPGGIFISLDTAGSEWKAADGVYRFYMNRMVPILGALLTGSKQMYSYLSASAAAFSPPEELEQAFRRQGFCQTGYVYRPRLVGGAALVWGRRP